MSTGWDKEAAVSALHPICSEPSLQLNMPVSTLGLGVRHMDEWDYSSSSSKSPVEHLTDPHPSRLFCCALGKVPAFWQSFPTSIDSHWDSTQIPMIKWPCSSQVHLVQAPQALYVSGKPCPMHYCKDRGHVSLSALTSVFPSSKISLVPPSLLQFFLPTLLKIRILRQAFKIMTSHVHVSQVKN